MRMDDLAGTLPTAIIINGVREDAELIIVASQVTRRGESEN